MSRLNSSSKYFSSFTDDFYFWFFSSSLQGSAKLSVSFDATAVGIGALAVIPPDLSGEFASSSVVESVFALFMMLALLLMLLGAIVLSLIVGAVLLSFSPLVLSRTVEVLS